EFRPHRGAAGCMRNSANLGLSWRVYFFGIFHMAFLESWSIVCTSISGKGQSMATLGYRQSGLTLPRPGGTETNSQVRDLQRGLRRLGYLQRGIDGDFSSQTELAVKGLQHDLLHNDGGGSDGNAAVKMVDFNKGRVSTVTGEVDQNLVECL